MMHPDYQNDLVFERPSLQREMAFAMGSALHGVVQTHMQMCQLVRGPQDIEVEYINTEHHVRGRIDWVTHHPNGASCRWNSRLALPIATTSRLSPNLRGSPSSTWAWTPRTSTWVCC